jgi:hypothetical protein
MILDSRGQLVWQSTEEAFAAAANLKVQQYRGEEYLTFWAGKKAGSQGKGKFYMVFMNLAWASAHTWLNAANLARLVV